MSALRAESAQRKVSNLRSVDNETERSLYEVRKKIYPRAVSGVLARYRVLVVILTQLVFYGLPWLSWNGRQAVLFDLAARKFYIFGLVFWPQDFILLTALLIISAYSLFLFTAVAGRVWCGYACPQTVYTEIFLWIERRIEGDRMKQMKLDREPWRARKLALKGSKHALWIALALWTGFTFVGYFTPIKTLGGEVATLSTGPWETFWVLFYGFATYGNAGWMREQVCKYMCPYARFQSVMFDPDTLTVTYDQARGEPRGARSKSVDFRAAGLGACVDCGICVQVCPTGIDIRDGLQYECIGCGACIDGCNQVMDKMNYPRGLIRYSTLNALAGKYPESGILARVLRPRVLVYSTVLMLIVGAVGATIYVRVPLKVNVMRDRAALVRETPEGLIENVYRLQLMNTAETPRRFVVSAVGVSGVRVASAAGSESLHVEPNGGAYIDLPAGASRTIPVRLQAHPDALKLGGNRVEFHVLAADDPRVSVQEKTNFIFR